VWFSCGEPGGDAVPVHRVVPSTKAVLRASLQELLAGPTAAEREAGYTSWFSETTADLLDRVEIEDGVAVIDFGNLPNAIPNAGSSAGSQMLLSQLDATVFQFPTVTSARYLIGGECEAWSGWLQLDSCESAP
jgi:spore germination protein GerM